MAEDACFGYRVYTGKRIVQHQDARIHQYGAGDGNALFLPAREHNSALSHDRVHAMRQSRQVGVRPAILAACRNCALRGFFHS